ncbi:MAG: septal ring lytic transglycosylase RlpA family protein [Solirubrobacterales bacterium]
MGQNKNRIRWAAALAAAIASVALIPVASQAATGGASAFGGVGSGAQNGSGGVFTGWKRAGATWYGPGLYGRHTACGQTLRPKTIGVAHKSLPCGTRVKFRYRGHVVVARVIDRGPYVRGVSWDLTEAASERLDFESVGRDKVAYAVPKKVAHKMQRAERSR